MIQGEVTVGPGLNLGNHDELQGPEAPQSHSQAERREIPEAWGIGSDSASPNVKQKEGARRGSGARRPRLSEEAPRLQPGGFLLSSKFDSWKAMGRSEAKWEEKLRS